MFKCRSCANTPFAAFFGITADEEETPPKRKTGKRNEGGGRAASYAGSEGGSTTRTEAFEPRCPEDMKMLARAWENYVHPRAKKMWSSGGQLHRILDNIARGCNQSDDPVLGDDRQCVEWHGSYSGEERLPVMIILQPVTKEGVEDSGEFEEVLSHVNRVLVFLYADDSSFSELENRTEPLIMACGNRTCVNLTHISLDD
eukprot:GHVS01019612.1.p1 GENE.GHVS01019612.1~~GHVS01019612.1.p1  ORF type:complete len:200 (+),score=29.98 GHVS01019612.1:224-823(+)